MDPGDCHANVDIPVKPARRVQATDESEKLHKVEGDPYLVRDQKFGGVRSLPIESGSVAIEEGRASVHAQVRARDASRVYGLIILSAPGVQTPVVGPAALPARGDSEVRASPLNHAHRSDTSAQVMQQRVFTCTRFDSAIPEFVVANRGMGERM